MRKIFTAVALATLVQSSAYAKVESLDGASLGEHWCGPPRTVESLKGHVVLWEKWGFN